MTKVVLGIAWQGGTEPIHGQLDRFAQWLSDQVGFEVRPRISLSYQELKKMIGSGESDVAWLPPFPFVQVSDESAIEPLVRNMRAGHADYHAALIVRTDSGIRTIEGLRGSRAAWVDRDSASGHVVPRVALAGRGFDAQQLFREERFYGSHEAVVNAVISGRAHVGATYAQLGEDGKIVKGGWSRIAEADQLLRVLVTVGKIPGDVIAVRKDMPERVKCALKDALLHTGADARASALARRVFGVDGFVDGPFDSYDVLRGPAFEQS